MKELEKTYSVCPACIQDGKVQKIDASIIEDDEKVWITKVCQKHGPFKEIYFSDVNLYKRWMKFKVTGRPISVIQTSLFNDPELYAEHTSQTVLTNLVVTNRYNLKHNQDFLDANTTSYVYEPSLDQLRNLMQQTRSETPLGSKSIQITGGEPTLREDLFEIVQIAKKIGFTQVQIYTNGLKLAENIDYCQHLKDENVNTIYMSFNGVTETTNPLLAYHKKALEHLRKVHLNVVLVPILIGNKNVHESGKIVSFALNNIDVVRGIHFQPICFCGKNTTVKDDQRESQRVDYVQMINGIEKEFPGMISRDDFYPVSFISPISRLIEAFTKDPQVEFTAHPGCGGSTFIFIENGKPLPITRFFNVEAYMTFLDEQTTKKGPLRKLRIASAFIKNINNFVDVEKAPQEFNLKQILKEAAIGGSQYALRKFHHQCLSIGSMWYQDAWNLNIDRLQRCVIHCPTFEGIVPFCSYTGLGYGERIQEKHSIPVRDWEKKTGHILEDDFRILAK
jgi:7,8-dihydro-6-hydroxymethylpterin dimethyltransferase